MFYLQQLCCVMIRSTIWVVWADNFTASKFQISEMSTKPVLHYVASWMATKMCAWSETTSGGIQVYGCTFSSQLLCSVSLMGGATLFQQTSFHGVKYASHVVWTFPTQLLHCPRVVLRVFACNVLRKDLYVCQGWTTKMQSVIPLQPKELVYLLFLGFFSFSRWTFSEIPHVLRSELAFFRQAPWHLFMELCRPSTCHAEA